MSEKNEESLLSLWLIFKGFLYANFRFSGFLNQSRVLWNISRLCLSGLACSQVLLHSGQKVILANSAPLFAQACLCRLRLLAFVVHFINVAQQLLEGTLRNKFEALRQQGFRLNS